MTARLVWEGLLTELSKVNAPSMLLLDFNYFFNKAVNQYINKRYNIYDVNQQTTDDLRVLKATATIKAEDIEDSTSLSEALKELGGEIDTIKLLKGSYFINLPLDYLHMLNCICIYRVDGRFKCYDKGNVVKFAAKRLTGDSWSVVMNDYYNRPLPERPYYYINNINTSVDLPTNPIQDDELQTTSLGTDVTDTRKVPTKISLKDIKNNSVIEKEAGVRFGNSSPICCEIRYGGDDSVFKLIGVFIDYIKAPQTIRLTWDQVNETEDHSQIMEFPDYVCWEIINELVQLVMENTADPRLLTHNSVTQTIASPVQQLQQPIAPRLLAR